ncbi:MAG: DNA repair protein RecO [Candidatus Gracilibacteria bacterium]|jgi:DNA repair protein RecO (recombination protein O)
MKSKNIKCIILGHKNFGEADKFVFLYSDETGKIRTMAKGARKITSKFMGHLETLNICDVSLYFGPKNIIITEISTIDSHNKLRKNLDKLAGALQIAEITNQVLYEGQSLDNLFRLMEKTLQHLNITKKPLIISMAYIVKLLDKVGIIPDFKKTRLSLEQKYIKFLEFIKSKHFTEIEQIALTKEEKTKIVEILTQIIERETEKHFKSFYI